MKAINGDLSPMGALAANHQYREREMGSFSSEAPRNVVLFPFMSKGHTIPLLHLARFLLRRHLAVTIFTSPANRPFISQSLSDTNVSIIDIPFPKDIPQIPADIESTDKLPSMSLFPSFALSTALMQPEFERHLQTLPPILFMVSDGFLWWTLDSAKRFGIPRLVFYGMNCYSMVVGQYVAVNGLLMGRESDDEQFPLPDFPWIKLTRNDFDRPFTHPNPKDPLFDFIMKNAGSALNSYGYIVNSFHELEGFYVDYYNTKEEVKAWSVGPLCLAESIEAKGYENGRCSSSWFSWLDQKFEQGCSVIYVAFGSQAKISSEQLKEIATGLEESNVNFLWVTRNTESDLPEGFEERVNDRGVLVREWVNQREILMHPSIKGFLSHCGWNSALESICAGVPILAWPMLAEQPLNARFLVEEIKIALRMETCNGSVEGFVEKDNIVKMVKELMEGEKGGETRKKVKELAVMAKKAVEEGGSSSRSLDSLINQICNTGATFPAS